jgi:hypothetical protein
MTPVARGTTTTIARSLGVGVIAVRSPQRTPITRVTVEAVQMSPLRNGTERIRTLGRKGTFRAQPSFVWRCTYSTLKNEDQR